MKIAIHRGLEQIGGCITEISTESSRVFIDMGRNLPGCGEKMSPEEEATMVESIFAHNPKQHEAVVYTHAHEDHVGLFDEVPANVPQYMSEGGKQILLKKYELLKKRDEQLPKKAQEKLGKSHSFYEGSGEVYDRLMARLNQFHTWERSNRPKPFRIGDIQITPFYNCHSIYDSYMFLIEAEGKRIWHMGDFRKHGYLGKRLYDVLRIYARKIDVLITEGTMLGRSDECVHESVISNKMANVMQAFKYVFVLASSTDIERLAAIKEAGKKAHKSLYVCSSMTKEMMRLFTERESKTSKGLFDFHPHFYKKGSSLEPLMKRGFVMVVGTGVLELVQELYAKLPEEETLLIYSSWDGYYKDPEQVKVNPSYQVFRSLFHNVVNIHTAGHADRKTIEEVIKIVNPRKAVVCIHKEEGQSLDSLNLNEEIKKKIVNEKMISL
ncbi:MAG: MBL fold metallo-hydrolase [Bacteroidaceae bacterium]|nr:MBL fold metallo-hydrolase [Bacteroidaceae bacterium]